MEIKFSVGSINLLFAKSDAGALQSIGFAMKKKFDRLFNTKTTEDNSDKEAELGKKTFRRPGLAKKAIEALCSSRPVFDPASLAVDAPVIQEIQSTTRVDAGKESAWESSPLVICECCGRDGFRKNMLVKIDSGQFICLPCLQDIRNFKS